MLHLKLATKMQDLSPHTTSIENREHTQEWTDKHTQNLWLLIIKKNNKISKSNKLPKILKILCGESKKIVFF